MVEVQMTVGRFTLRVGAPHGTRADPAPAPAPREGKELAKALRTAQHPAPKTAADVVTGVVEQAEEVTAAVERANDLVTALARGLTLNPKALEQQVNALLDLAERADREGRFEDEVRLARALVALLALVPRWLALIAVLRRAAAAAAAVGDRASEAWAHHELGSFALGADDAHAASYHLNEALGIRESIGDEAGAEATRHNLRLLSLVRPTRNGWRPGRTAVAVAAGTAALLVVAGGLAIAAWRGGDEPRVLDDTAPTEAEPPTVGETTIGTEPPVTVDNQPPTARGFTLTVEEDTPEEWTPDVADPESDALECAIAPDENGEHGTAEIEGDCTGGTYTPSAGFSGDDEFAYSVTDGETEPRTAKVTVRVEAVNDPPVGGPDTIEYDPPVPTEPSFSVSIPVSELLQNDADEDGDTLTVTALAPREDVSFEDEDTVIYVFGAGKPVFTYTVGDGNGGEDTATVTLVPKQTQPPTTTDSIG